MRQTNGVMSWFKVVQTPSGPKLEKVENPPLTLQTQVGGGPGGSSGMPGIPGGGDSDAGSSGLPGLPGS